MKAKFQIPKSKHSFGNWNLLIGIKIKIQRLSKKIYGVARFLNTGLLNFHNLSMNPLISYV